LKGDGSLAITSRTQYPVSVSLALQDRSKKKKDHVMANRYRHFVLVGFRRAVIKRNVVKTHSGRNTTSGKQNKLNVLFPSLTLLTLQLHFYDATLPS
jgi:hypothetical protein